MFLTKKIDDKFGNIHKLILPSLYLLVLFFIAISLPESFGLFKLYREVKEILTIFMSWFPYWGPIVLGYFFWHQWIHYKQLDWISNIKWVILEIKVPKETFKSPLAMEVVFNALYQTGYGSWWDWYLKGRVQDYFSLEIVSFEGHIKFFIRTHPRYKNIIEAQLYAQYPDIEVYEVPDYTRYVDYRGKQGDWDIISTEYKLDKPDPYPIKTYIDFGLDRDPKEEFKIDPLASVIEHLGSIGKNEQIWVQIIMRAVKSKKYKKKDGHMGDWTDEAKEIINDKCKEKTPAGVPSFKVLMMTKGDQEIVAAIERSVAKLGFECGIRALYLAKKGTMDMNQTKALGGLWRPFAAKNLNELVVDGSSQTFGWDFPWEDINNIRLTENRKKAFNAYKHRLWFNPPQKIKYFILTSEELATIFHFPGGVVQTPTFSRIPSRKSEAPINLPI